MAKQCKSIFLLVGLVLISMASCQDKSSALIRTWKLQDMRLTKNVPDALKPTIQKSIDDIKKKSFSITYNADGTYFTQMGDKVLHGSWKLNFNSSKITAVTDGGQSKDYAIMDLNPSTYTFKTDEGGQDVIFVFVAAN
jgi:hypothetical protein